MIWKFLIALCLTLPTFAQSPLSYGEQRSRQDSDPVTMRARSEFARHIRSEFNNEKRRLGLTNLNLDFNSRMVAQRARGAESAMTQVPQEMKELMGLIAEAQTKPRALEQRLRGFKTLCHLSDEEIRKAVAKLAATKTLYLDYWGYIGRQQMLPKYLPSHDRLIFYSKWNERDSRYELTNPNQRLSLVIRGIHQSLNKRSWLDYF